MKTQRNKINFFKKGNMQYKLNHFCILSASNSHQMLASINSC